MSIATPGPVVFIVDDNDAVRDSLGLLLGLRGYSTRGYANGKALLSSVDRSARGCILLDLRMPDMDGLEVQAELAARGIKVPIIIMTAHGDVASARAALKAGAFDFLEKPIDDSLLSATIEAALTRDLETSNRADQQTVLQAKLARLTPREREVLDLVVHGRHNREIAAELSISPRTVEVYKARVMDKLQVDRLPDLIRIALDLDLSSWRNAS